jgi:hypothetical protein
MTERNAIGQFKGKARETDLDPDDDILSEDDFRLDHEAVAALAAFLDSPAGVKLRCVLRARRGMLVRATHVKPEEAAAQLAKVQAFEEFTELVLRTLRKRKEPPHQPQSQKGGAFRRVAAAAMP